MALTDEIRALRDQVLDELATAHNYYTDTKSAWRIVHKVIAAGNAFTIRNMTTGTVTNQIELAEKARGYVTEQLADATFQQFVSIFERFYFDFLALWLTAYPESLGKKTVDFKTILEQPDKESITAIVVRKELNELQYDRPKAWFAYLNDKVRLDCPSANEIDRIAEAKASRDVPVHNRSIANKTYESKSGELARHRDGERLRIPENYHREIWELIRKLVSDVSDAAMAKLSNLP